jgi:glycerol-3-phosphate acyltransferase PlsY
MNDLPTALALVVAAYLLGSLSSAVIVCRLAGLPDPRTEGSRNPGATNVLRIGGKRAAFFTLAGDMLKGLLPVLIAHQFGAAELTLGAVGLAALLGHLYPVFFGFDGGKGVATSLGVYIAYNWVLGLAVIATWLLVAGLFRYSSLAALSASLLAPVYAWLVVGAVPLVIATSVVCAFLFWRHRENLQRLLAGTESRIGSRRK